MPKYILTNRAVNDLSNIWNYSVENWSEKQADKYYNEILKQCSRLAKNPEAGIVYFNLVKDLRGSKINKHIVFFRKLENNDIEVERILHERMDLRTKLKK